MPEQSRFENVDVTASLEAIMKQNTGFYQSDLEIDKEIIAKAATSPHREDKTLLWFCRPSGTHCFRLSQSEWAEAKPVFLNLHLLQK